MNLGLNCQLHDCVYFLSVSRVRAFDYVCCFCCFGCWSSLPPLMPFTYIYLEFHTNYSFSVRLHVSRLLARSIAFVFAHLVALVCRPCFQKSVSFFSRFVYYSLQDFALLHSPVRARLTAFMQFFSLVFCRSKSRTIYYPLMMIKELMRFAWRRTFDSNELCFHSETTKICIYN